MILDGTPEMFIALRYAAQRSARNDGRVAILCTFDTLEFSHWKAVEDIAEAESRDDAESKIKEYENFILEFTNKNPKIYYEGDRVRCIINFLSDNKFISICFSFK